MITDRIKKIFSKKPFIYEVKGDCYILGQGVCKTCTDHSTIQDYYSYKGAVLSSDAVVSGFERLMGRCESLAKLESEPEINAEDNFLKLNLEKEDLESLGDQLDKFEAVHSQWDKNK
ncbi:MAG: hypothetical protein AAGU12_11405 [Clostridiales bacterium]